MEESAINTLHPDDAASDDIGGFFDPPDEAELEEEFNATAAEPDPSAPPTLSPEAAAAEGEAYRQEKEGTAPEPDEASESVEVPVVEGEEVPEPLQREQQLREIAEREKAEAAAKSEAAEAAEPQPAEDRALPSERPSMNAAEPTDTRQQERPYIVFQKVPLTEKVLKALLEQLPDAGAPRVAFFELHRAESRNVNGAVAAAYDAHKDALGNKCDLAAVTERSWQSRSVEVKPVTETQLAIS